MPTAPFSYQTLHCPCLDALQQITGTSSQALSKTPEGHTSCLDLAFDSGSKLAAGSGIPEQCHRAVEGLQGAFPPDIMRSSLRIKADVQRTQGSIDYQLYPVLRDPGSEKEMDLPKVTQEAGGRGCTFPAWPSVLGHCVKCHEEGQVKFRGKG